MRPETHSSNSVCSRRADGSAVAKSQKRSVACYRCHAQKIKCSGGRPCSRCRQAGHADQCSYANRDRKVRVDESYLEQLIQDSQELHARREEASRAKSTGLAETSANPYVRPLKSTNLTPARPEDIEVCFEVQESSIPVYINDAACVAFARRLCHCLRPMDLPGLYSPQRHYTDEPTLESQAQSDTEWPTLINAQLLIKTALGHINPGFHFILKKETLDGLKNIYQKEIFSDTKSKCKYFALFAIGQVYSAPNGSSHNSMVPGTTYFARAMNLLRIIPERPSMTHIETLLLLAYFCQFLNRFNSGYLLIGNALRLSLSIGLNVNVPHTQNITPMEREHRIRIWWSIYILDRFWGSKLGFSVQIHDEDIFVDLPTILTSQDSAEQFPDAMYQISTIELAKITGCMMKEIYTLKKSSESFLKREQLILIALQQWISSLPDPLRLYNDKPNPKHTVLLHLQFNYCVILAIRPVLLKLLRRHQEHKPMHLDEQSKHIVMTLSQACINAARYSLKLCLNEWTSGSLVIFGYAFPAFLFSSGLVLAMASLLPLGHSNDLTAFETAIEMLKALNDSNNISAKDLYEHGLRVQQCIKDREFPETIHGHERTDGHRDASLTTERSPSLRESMQCDALRPETPPFQDSLDNITLMPFPLLDFQQCEFTTEMILQSSMMQDFLSKPPSDMGSLDLPEILNEFDAAFSWLDDNPSTS